MNRAEFLATTPRRSGQSHRRLVECPDCGEWLPVTLHADAKTAPSVMYEASGRATATVANALDLPVGPPEHGGTCSSTTEPCTNCYMASLEGAYPSLARMAVENLTSLRHVAQHGLDPLAEWLAGIVQVSVDEQTALGIRRSTFRWHSGGDLGALVGTGIPRHIYPRAIRKAARLTPEVAHWVYTRELWALGSIKGPENLRVLVSVDYDNLETACTAAACHGLPVAVLADNAAHADHLWHRIREQWPELPRDIPCPATAQWKRDQRGPAHIVGPDGRRSTLERGAPAVGACIACQACLPTRDARSITFLMHNAGNRMTAALNTRRRLTVTAL